MRWGRNLWEVAAQLQIYDPGQLQAHDHEDDRHHEAPARPHVAEHGAHERRHRAQDGHDQGQPHHEGQRIEKGLLFVAPGIAADKADDQRDAGQDAGAGGGHHPAQISGAVGQDGTGLHDLSQSFTPCHERSPQLVDEFQFLQFLDEFFLGQGPDMRTTSLPEASRKTWVGMATILYCLNMPSFFHPIHQAKFHLVAIFGFDCARTFSISLQGMHMLRAEIIQRRLAFGRSRTLRLGRHRVARPSENLPPGKTNRSKFHVKISLVPFLSVVIEVRLADLITGYPDYKY